MTIRILVFLLLAVSMQAASYYVDYVSGADKNAGTSTGAAFQHCPGDPAATHNARSVGLVAGDTVYFKGGVVYVLAGSKGIIISKNGSPGNVITYDGNSAGTWGTGRAVVTDNYGSNEIRCFDGSGAVRRHITIRHFAFQNVGGSATLPKDAGRAVAARPGHGVVFLDGGDHITVDSCTFNGLGYIFNQRPMGPNSIDGNGIYLINVSHPLITNNVFTRCPNPVTYHSTTTGLAGGTISGNTFHDWIKWMIDIAPENATATVPEMTISGNSFGDSWQWDAASWTGYGSPVHTDGIFLRKDNNTAAWGTTSIYNNTFYTTQNGGGGSAYMAITEGPNADIFNNLFIYASKTRTIYLHNTAVPSPAQTIRILNNSFITSGVPCISIESGPNFGNTTFVVKNNAMQDLAAGSGSNFCLYLDTPSKIVSGSFDHNIYHSLNTTEHGRHGGTNGREFMSSTSFGEGGLRAMRGQGLEANGLNADMLYTKVDTNGNALRCDLRLQAGSPAIDAGINLTSLGITALNTDKAGNTRPSSGAWELGAYEYIVPEPAKQ